MSAPAARPEPSDAEVAGPPEAGTAGPRLPRKAAAAVAVLAVLAVLVGVATVLGHGRVVTPPAAAAGNPVAAAPTHAPHAGTLILSTRTIDLGRTGERADFDLGNTGDLPAQFQVSTRTRWLRLTSIGGSLAGTGSARVTVLADRTHLRPGRSTGTVLVTWDRGSARVTVSLEQPPAP